MNRVDETTAVIEARHIAAPRSEDVGVPIVRVHLLGGIGVDVGAGPVAPPPVVGRLVAYVGLAAPDAVSRAQAAVELWPDHNDQRATANLRSTIWRARDVSPDLIEVTSKSLRLNRSVWVDVRHPVEAIRAHGRLGHRGLQHLLPGWYDEWVLVERERVRQHVLRAVEEEARRCLDVGELGRAIDLALEAVALEPLRETPQRLLICAHVAEGNVSEAIRQYRRYQRLLADELGIAPGVELARLVAGLTRPQPPIA